MTSNPMTNEPSLPVIEADNALAKLFWELHPKDIPEGLTRQQFYAQEIARHRIEATAKLEAENAANGRPKIGHRSGCVTINCSGCGSDFFSKDYSVGSQRGGNPDGWEQAAFWKAKFEALEAASEEMKDKHLPKYQQALADLKVAREALVEAQRLIRSRHWGRDCPIPQQIDDALSSIAGAEGS